MHIQPDHPDGWHTVTAPGGYEWWYFDAQSGDAQTHLVAIFFQGFVFHPGYLRRHAAYLRCPTRRVPAIPADNPCVYLAIYRRGKIWRQMMAQYPSDAFIASTDTPDVRIGHNTIKPEGGNLQIGLTGRPWHITARGPKFISDETLHASLQFSPRSTQRPIERRFLSLAMTGADHHWILANPLCEVSGTIACGGEKIDFTGAGYHDHNYGTGPIGPGLRDWLWGRMLLQDRVLTFHVARPQKRQLPDEIHLVQMDSQSTTDLPAVSTRRGKTRQTGWGLTYPEQLQFCDSADRDLLTLINGRVVDSSPFYLRLIYDAQTPDASSTAFCEIAHPHRLRWPILGRMIEMSIDKNPPDDRLNR